MGKLVYFHTFNKYLFMSFNQKDLNTLGNIVANTQNLPIDQVIFNYEKVLAEIISKAPTRSRHTNVLRRMYGHFKKNLPKNIQIEIENTIDDFQKGIIPLSDTLRKLKILTSEFDNMYLAKQSYFLLFLD